MFFGIVKQSFSQHMQTKNAKEHPAHCMPETARLDLANMTCVLCLHGAKPETISLHFF